MTPSTPTTHSNSSYVQEAACLLAALISYPAIFTLRKRRNFHAQPVTLDFNLLMSGLQLLLSGHVCRYPVIRHIALIGSAM
jgi:hypothetical protein